MLKKIAFSFFSFCLLSANVYAVEADKLLVEVLEREDCGHCQDEKAFWEEVLQEREDLEVNYIDVYSDEGGELFEQVVEVQNMVKATPITLIGERVIQGFDTPETTGVVMLEALEVMTPEDNFTFEQLVEEGGIAGAGSVEGAGCEEDAEECVIETEKYPVKIPFVGVVDAKELSLPVMSLVLGFIDGFNPCAMWVLVTFLLVLMQIGDRRKMMQIAGLFIVAEAIMYYLILNVWLTVWNFVGLDNVVTPIVGTIAIGGGLFFLWEWKNSDGTCKVTNSKQKAKTRSKIQKLAAAEMTLLTIVGVVGLAFSVNVIEFACSIGIPQTFTKILDMNVLNFMVEQFYMLLYILMYMVDDVIVFALAFYSIDKIGLTTKYSRWCNLIGGILMLILGAILLLKPDLLVF